MIIFPPRGTTVFGNGLTAAAAAAAAATSAALNVVDLCRLSATHSPSTRITRFMYSANKVIVL